MSCDTVEMHGTGYRMADIAREAGVSVPTVSKVVNGRTDVSAETRTRVQRLLTARGYQRLRAGRPSARSGVIDLVAHEVDSQWFVSIMSGVQDAVAKAGLELIVSAVHGRASLGQRWLEALITRGSHGVVAVAALTDFLAGHRAELDRRGVPFVMVDAAAQPPSDIPSVGATNWAGGFSATEHLLTLGHRHIAIIGGPPYMTCRARTAGYRAALDAAGIAAEHRLIRRGDFTVEGGQRQAESLLRLAEPPTAIFAASDLHAMGVYQAARNRGLRVPEDLSVVGFDDLQFTEWTAPPLTTVHQPLRRMGATAADTLLRLAAGERIGGSRVELATELVIRASTAAPAVQSSPVTCSPATSRVV
jgi:DNA-binding LacI/PurR family transcriptional regulator